MVEAIRSGRVRCQARSGSDRWVFGLGNEPVVGVDRRTNGPVPRQRTRDEQAELHRDRDSS